jgi:hypothetical protein
MQRASRRDIVKGAGLPMAILGVALVGRLTHDDVLAAVVTILYLWRLHRVVDLALLAPVKNSLSPRRERGSQPA